MEESAGPVTRSARRRRIARDSIELTKQSNRLYPNLDSDNDSEENYSATVDNAGENNVGVLKSQSESEPEYSDDESDAAGTEVDGLIEVEAKDSPELRSITDSICFKVTILLLLCLPILVALYNEVTVCSLMMEKMLEEELDGRPLLSPSKRSEIGQNIIAKIDSSTSSDPLSIFIMFDEIERENVTSFSNNIAHIFSKCGSANVKSSESLSIGYFRDHSENLDLILDRKIESMVSAIVIQDFTELSWNQAKLFLRYCDNENAPYKDRLFVFTSMVSDCDPLRPDKSAEKALLNAWDEEEETIEALAVRVSAISVCFNK